MSNTQISVSEHDKAILDRIFNPLTPYQAPVSNDGQENDDTLVKNQDVTAEQAEARVLELDAVHCAERGDTENAEKLLSKAVAICPSDASCFNNRAQVRRLAKDIPGALSDIQLAIDLSNGLGPVACQAYTQRAIIHKFQEHSAESLSDFKKAAALGSGFAKQQVALSNPYAAMCNQMMCDMVQKVKEGKM